MVRVLIAILIAAYCMKGKSWIHYGLGFLVAFVILGIGFN